MRIEYEFQGKTYWVQFKDSFSRLEMRVWVAAQELRELTPDEQEQVADAIDSLGIGESVFTERDRQTLGMELRMLELLDTWCGACYLEDTEGNEYHDMSELDVAALEKMDWALFDFVSRLPSEVRRKHATLGKVKDEQ